MREQLRNQFIFAVRADRQLTTAEAMVALVIASYADLDGSNCFPSYDTIGGGAKMSSRSVKRHVQTLRTYGLLEVTSGAGRASNRYVLKLPKLPAEDVVTPVAPQVSPLQPPDPPSSDTDVTTKQISGDTPDGSGDSRDASGDNGDRSGDTPVPLHRDQDTDQDSDQDKGGDGRLRSPRLTPGVAPTVVPERDREAAPPSSSGIPSPSADSEEIPPATNLFEAASRWTHKEDGLWLEMARQSIEGLLERNPGITEQEVVRQLGGPSQKAVLESGVLEQFGLSL